MFKPKRIDKYRVELNRKSVMHSRSRSFERRICAQTQDLQIFKSLVFLK